MSAKTKETTQEPTKEPTQTIAAPNIVPAIIAAQDGFGSNPTVLGTGDEGGRLPRSMASDIKLKFVNGAWTVDSMPYNNRELAVYNKTMWTLRWENGLPTEITPVARGTATVDLAAMNAKVPREQWRIGLNGAPEPPYQLQRVLEFLDITSMERLSWPANVSVVGSTRASDDLEGRIIAARRLHGGDICPLVKLASKPMPTAFGSRLRPHFDVTEWVRLSDRGIERVAAMAAITDATK